MRVRDHEPRTRAPDGAGLSGAVDGPGGGGALEAAVDALTEGLVIFGRLGELRSMNEAAFRRLSCAPSGEPCGPRFVDEEGRPIPPDRTPVANALAGQTIRCLHLHLQESPDGRRERVVVNAAPIRGPDGRIDGAVLTFSDETAVHRLHEEREDLLRAITHDLRTPLNAVYLQAHLIERGLGGPEGAAERGKAIAKSCERMSEMLQDLADSTLLQAGRLQISPQPIDVGPFVAELLERLQGGLDAARVRLAVEDGLPAVVADPLKLERILVNLVSNALKYSPVQSEVQVRAASAPPGVRISVADRGVGITPEDQVHLFQRWYRARGARRPEGLGLGLYITRLLVEAQGGRIEVETQLGQGSTFHVHLPARRAEPPSAFEDGDDEPAAPERSGES